MDEYFITQMERAIIKQISKHTIWSVEVIEKIYKRNRSWDKTLLLLHCAERMRCSPDIFIE
jgi:hypothetical protein